MSARCIDIGNARLKWRDPGGAMQAQAHARGGWEELFDHAWRAAAPPHEVRVCCVAGEACETALRGYHERRGWPPPRFLRASAQGGTRHGKLRNAYREPARLGADRWAALLAARELQAGALCVVNAGTALTLDVLDSDGQHQGGIIMPGQSMLRAALAAGTAGVRATAAEAPALLGRDTSEAVAAGSLHAAVALIERLRALALPQAAPLPCLISGGDAPALLPWLAPPLRHEPELVLIGLDAWQPDETAK
jgi:type III pantothenate kinase